VHDTRQVERRRDATGLSRRIADHDRQGIADLQLQRHVPVQQAGPDLRPAQVLQQGDRAAALPRRHAHARDEIRVSLVRAV